MKSLVRPALFAAALSMGHAAQAASPVAITEWMYNGSEFIEFTNLSGAALDLTGWSFDDDSRTAGTVSLSDFGTLAMIPHPYALSRDVLVIDPDKAALATLRPWFTQKLAVSGDNEKFQLIGEYTLECRNEKAHAAIADLT